MEDREDGIEQVGGFKLFKIWRILMPRWSATGFFRTQNVENINGWVCGSQMLSVLSISGSIVLSKVVVVNVNRLDKPYKFLNQTEPPTRRPWAELDNPNTLSLGPGICFVDLEKL